jgi:L-histidine N-alpha-methyltransferase
VPIDVSEQTLRNAVVSLAAEYPGLAFHGIVADFHGCFKRLPASERRLVAFLGSTIGNLDPMQRSRFLFDLDCALTREDRLLLGVDLVKDTNKLLAAYNDAAGITAAFNRNALHVLNAELGSNFDPGLFTHHAIWNEQDHRIEMHLRAETDQTVSLPELAEPIVFAAGSDLRTEISSKFTVEGITKELWDHNFVVDTAWVSADDEFALLVAQPYC